MYEIIFEITLRCKKLHLEFDWRSTTETMWKRQLASAKTESVCFLPLLDSLFSQVVIRQWLFITQIKSDCFTYYSLRAILWHNLSYYLFTSPPWLHQLLPSNIMIQCICVNMKNMYHDVSLIFSYFIKLLCSIYIITHQG